MWYSSTLTIEMKDVNRNPVIDQIKQLAQRMFHQPFISKTLDTAPVLCKRMNCPVMIDSG